MCVPVCVWGGRAGLVGLCVVLHVKNMWLRNSDLSLLLHAYLYLGSKCVYIFGFIFPCGRKPSCFRMKTCFWASLSFQEIHVKRCNALWSDGNVTVCVCDSWSDVFFTLEAVGIVQHCKVCLHHLLGVSVYVGLCICMWITQQELHNMHKACV